MKARKKPIEVEAWQVRGHFTHDTQEFFGVYPDFVRKALNSSEIYFTWEEDSDRHYISNLMVETLEGTMKCGQDDYLIKGIHGELYPCEKSIFEESYEVVEHD